MDFDPNKYFAGKMGLLFQKLLYVTDMTEEDLAKKSGVSKSTVRSVLKGEHLSVSGKYGTQKPPSEEFSAVPPA